MSREALSALGTFVLVAALAFDEGGYAATAWGWSGVAVFALLAVLLARGAGRPRAAAIVFVGALAGLAGWIAASTLWSTDVAASVLEVERIALYVGVAAAFVLAPSGPSLLAGVLGAVTLLCGYGLSRWLLGDPEVPLSADPQAADRLSEPIGYANGVAVLAAMGLLLAAGFAARASSATSAAASAAPAPMLAATLYFTFGRGAWLALAAGFAVAVAVGPRRLQLAAVGLALAVPCALAVVAADRLGAGGGVAAVVLVLCLLAAAVPVPLREARFEPSARVRTAFGAALVAAPAAATAAALVVAGGPGRIYESFRAAPAPIHGDTSSRVFSLSGSNRADYWSVAWRTYEDEPILGAGAGAYARIWLRERPVPQPVRDAHSLYLETLAELGLLGLALLAVALAAPVAARRRDWTPVAVAPYAAFLAHAAQDWDWELPAVTVAALACGAALIAGTAELRLPRATAVVAGVLCAAAAVAFVGNHAVASAENAVDRLAWADAADAARRARALQPWSPEPSRLLGEIELAEGSRAEARRHFRRGLRQDDRNFELWIDLGLASEGAARREAFARAARLNPLSPELEELGFESG